MVLSIKALRVLVDQKPIIKGLSLSVKPGQIHAIMGPNGSGKSTLAYTLAGHPSYSVESGTVTLGHGDSKNNVLSLSPDERAKAGLFLAFQYPVEIPGVRVEKFLKLARQARFADQPDQLHTTALEFRTYLKGLAKELEVKEELLQRGLNEGFSGGEKKRLEILQMAVLEPRYAVLDESDSGLDIDAIKAVAGGVKTIVKKFNTGVVVITHYQRILQYLNPDVVHVMVDGNIIESGGAEIAQRLEVKGYALDK